MADEAQPTPFDIALQELADHLANAPTTADVVARMPAKRTVRSPVPEYLLQQQQREGVPGANSLGGPEPDEALDIVNRASAANRLSDAGFDPNVTLGGSIGSFLKHDVPAAAFGILPGGRIAGKIAAAAIPALATLYPSAASPADMPADPASDKALNDLRARQDAIRQQMDKQSEIMSAKTPRPRGKGQPEASEQSDPAFFTAKKAYDNLNQQFNELGGQISEEQGARRARARRQQEGDARVENARKNRGTADAILEDYGPTAGYIIGAGLGAWKGGSTAGKFTQKAQTLANEAATALQPSAGWPRRAGGVNDFYARGGADEVPFPAAPGQTPPFRINPDTPEASSLYRQTPGREALAHAPWLALSGADATIGGYLENKYSNETIDAEKAMQADGSPANIARWEDAKRKEAFWGTLGNAGRAAALTQIGVGTIPGAVGNRARPATGPADAERAAVDDWIRRAGGAALPPPNGGPGPAPGLAPPQSRLALPAPVQPTSPAPPAPQGPTGGPAGPATPTPKVPPKRQSQPAAQSSPPPGVDIPKGHEWDDRLTGSKVRGPNGKIAPMPKDTTPASAGKAPPGTDPAVEYLQDTEGKLLRGSDAGDFMPWLRNKLSG